METQTKKETSQSQLKELLWIIGGIFGFTLAVLIIGMSGYYLFGKLALEWLFALSLAIGIGLYMVAYMIYRKLRRV
mgnify:CR=1 FL=1